MSESQSPLSPQPHIVVVDDDEDLCELLTFRLKHHGYRVTTEHTCRGGIEILEREPVDAVLVDLRLDGESGMDLLREVPARSLDLPIIMLTAHGTIRGAVEAIKLGAYGFLTKPFDDHELLLKLGHAIEHVRLRREVDGLRRLVGDHSGSHRLVGTSASIVAVRNLIARVAPADASVLVFGESGTGKELAARNIHALSQRKDAPFVAVNCGALPSDLLESELFGYKRGAFTGALKDKQGLFAAASGGTLFLDEIGDAPPSVQVKLLRVLQERTFTPVGATTPEDADVRIVAATNRDLRAEVEAGRFREDLFYRLHVIPITMPPLRERREDILLLAEVFLARVAIEGRRFRQHLTSEAFEMLIEQDWPGNVRELANVVHGAALLAADAAVQPRHIAAVMPRRPNGTAALGDPTRSLVSRTPKWSAAPDSGSALPPLKAAREQFDRAYLEEALRRAGGNVSAAAKLSGRNRTDFYDLLRRHNIDASAFRTEKGKQEEE